MILLSLVVFTFLAVLVVISLSHSIMLAFSAVAFIEIDEPVTRRLPFSHKLQMVVRLFPAMFTEYFSEFSRLSIHLDGLLSLGFAVAFFPFLNFVILITAWTIQGTQRFTKRPLSLLLERLEESPNGVFTTLAFAVSATLGIIVALSKAIPTWV
jgi:hypothetical protein